MICPTTSSLQTINCLVLGISNNQVVIVGDCFFLDTVRLAYQIPRFGESVLSYHRQKVRGPTPRHKARVPRPVPCVGTSIRRLSLSRHTGREELLGSFDDCVANCLDLDLRDYGIALICFAA